VSQLFTQQPGNRKIVGTVGELQFEVIQYRLKHEYGASCSFIPVNMFKECWITSDNPAQMQEFLRVKASNIAFDKDGNQVYLAESPFLLNMAKQNYADITFIPQVSLSYKMNKQLNNPCINL
jgi:peptide chain release factor 3